MPIVLQHNAAHLGIVTGNCLSEASTSTLNPRLNKAVLGSAVIAAVSTALAELLGGAIALNMLFGIPIKLGTILVLCFILWILYTNSYRKLEKWIIGFVSLIGISFIFAIALLFAGISSSVTAGMVGGSIFAGMFGKDYNIDDTHTKLGIEITLIGAAIVIFFITDPFKDLIYSQMLLSIQLPITIFLQIYLTSSKKVMGKYDNTLLNKITLWIIGLIVTGLNVMLFLSFIL